MDAGRMPGLGDGEPRDGAAAQGGNSWRPGGRLAKGRLGGCTGGCLALLLGCVLLSAAFPVEAQAVSTSIRATIRNIGTQRPYRTDALPTQMTLWQGRLYAPGPFGSTSVSAPDTGKQLSTFSGDVVGSDEQLLYVALGRVSMSVHQDGGVSAKAAARLPLIARDARGAQVWTYPTGAGDVGDQYHVETWICQVQGSGDLVYVRLSSQIVALDKTDGSVRWTYPYDSTICLEKVQLVITQQALYLLARSQVVALSASDGQRRWQQTVPAQEIIADEQSVYLAGKRSLTVLAAPSGASIWQENVGVTVHDDLEAHSRFGGVLVDGQVVYMSDEVGQITARRAATGALLWRSDALQGTRTSFTRMYLLGVRDSVLYTLQDNPGQLAALSGATGRVLWSMASNRLGIGDEPSRGTALVGATGDLLYLATGPIYSSGGSSQSYGSRYRAIDTRSGQLRWQQEVPDANSDPLLDGQSLYSVSLLHRRQVTTGGFGGPRDVANCSDIASVHHFSAASGVVVWQRATPFPCTSHDNYF
jgi:outer membrane protein assembly factor BamB